MSAKHPFLSWLASVPEELVAMVVDQPDLPHWRLSVTQTSPSDRHQLFFFSPKRPHFLTDLYPLLQPFGLIIEQCTVAPWHHPDHPAIQGGMHCFDIGLPQGISWKDFDAAIPVMMHLLTDAMEQAKEHDDTVQLIFTAGLQAREIQLVRAWLKYIHQYAPAIDYGILVQSVCRYPAIVKQLVALFDARLNPQQELPIEQVAVLQKSLDAAIRDIPLRSDYDCLRQCHAVVAACLRTNYYTTNYQTYKDYPLSLKIRPKLIPDMPTPVPYAEIFVYNASMEGVHLRYGLVARGGIRWSDRLDYRTEVAGLMKAQIAKNAIIIPTGAKGGFLVKNTTFPSREARQAAAIAAYQDFLRGMLDVTDNQHLGVYEHPKEVVAHDTADGYLVVAADKGTASFSDIANELSKQYHFWLGDGFATGGSVGYDHKKMGITARGAWVSVEHHSASMGCNPSVDPISVIGIGDMSGDVFGNGMLQSKTIRLIAAFNHQHIFIDPHPDPERSFLERQRLFALASSSWEDYDKAALSPGGGVYDRREKELNLAPEALAAIGLSEGSYSPEQVIRAILTSSADLLYNGGIGTYIKASYESHADVQDKANDAVRVNANHLRVKMIAEGGNLGMTQASRIEAAMRSLHLNTDTIDNSGGVNCSDYEVNIKIMLSIAQSLDLVSHKVRNQLLHDMTDSVASRVLYNNALQNTVLDLESARAAEWLEWHVLLLKRMEAEQLLNLASESFDTPEELLMRGGSGSGLTRPELCVLMSYTKLWIKHALFHSHLAQDRSLDDLLLGYFPEAMESLARQCLDRHPLRAEMLASLLANGMVNHCGMGFLYMLMDETGLEWCDIARAYVVAMSMVAIDESWRWMLGWLMRVPFESLREMLHDQRYVLHKTMRWILHHLPVPLALSYYRENFRAAFETLCQHSHEALDGDALEHYQYKYQRYVSFGLTSEEASSLATRVALSEASAIVALGQEMPSMPLIRIALFYHRLERRYHIAWVKRAVDQWAAMQPPSVTRGCHASIKTMMYDLHRRLAQRLLLFVPDDASAVVELGPEAWEALHDKELRYLDEWFYKAKSTAFPDLSMIVIAIQRIQSLLRRESLPVATE